ncbi:hypothetical protein HUJ04_009552 [Dendroctonus ponderosae]|uniref:Organic solute transporter alpha-like protein n=1 Tax=Dendroctonus ponderosae TaxID=77166 RepID=A0AAR5QGU8_DENPD|nr:hypothetical protein HUJ04_009539 [Dendroctonus ponderosae]KAH1019784.1 hypothetical protein HUJ04_009552 [Dendroctonus ponderosae]
MEPPNQLNSCSSSSMPSVQDYFNGASIYVIPLAAVGAAFLMFSLLVFANTLRFILRRSCSKAKTFTTFITAIYPVIGFLSYCFLLVPRSSLLCEALSQGFITVALYQLFCLLMAYGGGHASLIETAGSVRIDLKEPPCCCWPCCALPTFALQKKAIDWFQCLVLQVPLVQGLVYFVFLLMWAENLSLYEANYWYLQPVLIISILTGIWGLTITIKALSSLLDPEFRLRTKLNILQGVLLFSKLQPLLIKVFVWTNLLPCNPPLTPQLYANMIQSALLIMEMALLGLLVRRIYRRQLPEVSSLKREPGANGPKLAGEDNPSYG